MEPHGFVGNRQSESGSAAARLTARRGAKEGPKDISQSGFRDTRAIIKNVHDDFPFDQVDSAIKLYLRPGRRIADRVTQDII